MLEYIGQAILSVNILDLGAFPLMTALAYAISREVSEGNMQTFMLMLMVIYYSYATIIFGVTREAGSYFVASAIIIIILMMPTGLKEQVIQKKQ